MPQAALIDTAVFAGTSFHVPLRLAPFARLVLVGLTEPIKSTPGPHIVHC